LGDGHYTGLFTSAPVSRGQGLFLIMIMMHILRFVRDY